MALGNGEPKVSVIIPVYNAEQYLQQCLDSVVGQTLKEIEIICVDDGSTDRSFEILKEYQKKDQRIKLLSQQNLHAGVARNSGLEIAKGKYVHFLDADDWVESNAYEVLFREIEKTKADVCICFFEKFDNQTQESRKVSHPLNVDKYRSISSFRENPRHFLYNAVVPWNKIYNLDFLKRNRIVFDDLICSNDRSFYIHVLLCASKIEILNEHLIHYRTNNVGSLVGEKRLRNFECHFRSFENVWKLIENENDEIKRMVLDITLRDFFSFYNKAEGEIKEEIEKKLIDYISTMPMEIFNNNITKYPWAKQYLPLIEKYSLDTKTNSLFAGRKNKVIVSLTSFPARISTVHKTIITLLDQTYPADQVILWLAEEEFPHRELDLPKRLLALKNDGLEIKWCNNIRSYKKLIPTLKLYPDAVIVTADDDNYYQPTWLERLYQGYLEYPDCIQCHRATKFVVDEKGAFQIISGGRDYYHRPSYLNKLVGAGGVLYPPHCFHPDIINESKFMSLAPTSDDIWFWLMGTLSGYKVNVVENNIVKLSFVEGTQEGPSLTQINDHGEKLFFVHLNNILEEYPQLKIRLLCAFPEDADYEKRVNDPSVNISAISDIDVLQQKYQLALTRAKIAEQEIRLIYKSWTYRIGRFITWVPRKTRGLVRCYRENGADYTRWRILVHLGIKKEEEKDIKIKTVPTRPSEEGASLPIKPDEGQPSLKKSTSDKPVAKDYNYYASLDPSQYKEELVLWYERVTKTHIDIENPKTFNEKIQWLKLYDSTPLKTRLADKYLVRDWVKEKIGEQHLIPLLGVWDKFSDIDFNKLPNSFVLKTNHGSGWNYIVRDKKNMDLSLMKEKFDGWMKKNFAFAWGLEFHYMNIPPKIIAEKYISDLDGEIFDYRFFCFNGVPKFVWVDVGSGTTHHKRNIYDMQWKFQNYKVNYPNIAQELDCPNTFSEMKKYAKILSEGFAFVRVDFYSIDGHVYFGEITFTPQSGAGKWESEEQNLMYGDLIKIPPKSPIPERNR